MSFLHLVPVGIGESRPDAPTPKAPMRYFHEEPGFGYMLYPSSDLIVKSLQLKVSKLWKAADEDVDIKLFSAPLLILWLTAMVWLCWKIWKISQWHASFFCAWLLLISDPINMLYLNTLYSEFLAFITLSIFIGICWLALLRQRINTGLTLAGLMALIFLATSKEQYMLLPLSLLLQFSISNFRATLMKSNILIRLCVAATVVIPILLYSNTVHITQAYNMWLLNRTHSEIDTVYEKYFNLSELIGQANKIDTIMEAVLPASNNPEQMLQTLGFSENCKRFIGKNWYTGGYRNYQKFCPEALKISLLQIASALLSQPRTLLRMIMSAARQQHCFIASPHLGQLEGGGAIITSHDLLKKQGKVQLHSTTTLSMNKALYMLPSAMWKIIVIMLLILPISLVAALTLKRKKQLASACLPLLVTTHYIFFSSILGDGYVDLGRHTVLGFTLGCLLAVALPYLLWQIFSPRAR